MEFEFKVYSRRWGRYDTYRLTKTRSGWNIRHKAINGDSEPSGKPILYANFDQDSISYPSGLEFMVMHIWQQLDSKEIDETKTQRMLDDLAEWVSECEMRTPKWEGWN